MNQQFNTTAEALKAYGKRRFNPLIAPIILEPTDNFRLAATEVKITPNTEATYWLEEKQGWAIAKPGLLALAGAADIRFGPTRLTYDNDGSPVASLVGQWQTAPGTWQEIPGSYALNRAAREAAMRLAAEKESGEERTRLLALAEAEIARMARFGVQMAETGAILRPIRAFLGIKHTYSAKELRRPFVVFRIHFVVTDDQALALAQRVMAQSFTEVFGEPTPSADDTTVRLAQALLEKSNPPPPRVATDDGGNGHGLRDYHERCRMLTEQILQVASDAGLTEVEARHRVRQESGGKGLQALTPGEMASLLARWRAEIRIEA